MFIKKLIRSPGFKKTFIPIYLIYLPKKLPIRKGTIIFFIIIYIYISFHFMVRTRNDLIT